MLAANSASPADLIAWSERLVRVEAGLDEPARATIGTLAHGRSLVELAEALRTAADPEAIRSAAELLAANEGGCACSGDAPPAPTTSQLAAAADRLLREALTPFTGNQALREHLVSLGCRLEFSGGV